MATAEQTVHVSEFTNEPFIDFTKPENRSRMGEALKKVKSEFGREYPMWLNGQKVTTTDKRTSTNPSRPSEVIGVFQNATKEMARQAVEDAHRYFDTWKRVSAQERAKCLFRAAKMVRERKFELNALVCYEVGKTWVEADADIAETIDFLEFYGREMLRLGEPQKLTPMRGERNYLVYIPLGVGVVIPPWNFPCAIMAGMTVASLVTGNTVILKPAADSPTIAARFIDILYEAGIPKEAVNFITGPGSVIGDVLVQHPKTRYIGFTGSKEVGLRISELAGKTVPGQMWIKRTVLEMGGKDGIVVDEEADIDAAVEGTVQAAFGYQGQKCSACSRAIVSEKIYDTFVQKLVERTKKITVGPSEDPDNYMGPVISPSAMKTILDYIEVGRKEGKLLIGGKRAVGDGYFIEPTIIVDVDPKSRLAQEEVFGPVLAVIKAQNYDQALEIANNTEFGLTGAVYSKNPEKIKKAEETFHVGNLYLNRKCTGAMVGAHPFGGFNMSGTDSKAGGKDYLLLFMQGKSIAEKVS
ncbi:MAG: L-glutamate gamma-semialdehyde dehydrogenase [Acidobacteria bacterium]|nr:MAG: L-glutamate gamma-semialdehyde dehydrogenase [Acidobacteriota bacterium]PYU62175.1 MAG: L-glutamate gamma-semialdehyde dehydrogenase [Acidobacteriota bacterium]